MENMTSALRRPIIAGLVLFAGSTAASAEQAAGGQSLESAANDPTASLMSVQIQDVYAGDYYNLDDEQGNILLLRSAVPFKTGRFDHIARGTLPIITDSPSGESGIGISFSLTCWRSTNPGAAGVQGWWRSFRPPANRNWARRSGRSGPPSASLPSDRGICTDCSTRTFFPLPERMIAMTST